MASKGNSLFDRRLKQKQREEYQKRIKNVKGKLDLTPPRNLTLLIQLNRLHAQQERQSAIDKQNLVILERITEIKKKPALVDHKNDSWQPSNDRLKKFRERRQRRLERENQMMSERLQNAGSYYSAQEWEKDYKKHMYYLSMLEAPKENESPADYEEDGFEEEENNEESLPPVVPPGTPTPDDKEDKPSDESQEGHNEEQEDNASLPPIDSKPKRQDRKKEGAKKQPKNKEAEKKGKDDDQKKNSPKKGKDSKDKGKSKSKTEKKNEAKSKEKNKSKGKEDEKGDDDSAMGEKSEPSEDGKETNMEKDTSKKNDEKQNESAKDKSDEKQNEAAKDENDEKQNESAKDETDEKQNESAKDETDEAANDKEKQDSNDAEQSKASKELDQKKENGNDQNNDSEGHGDNQREDEDEKGSEQMSDAAKEDDLTTAAKEEDDNQINPSKENNKNAEDKNTNDGEEAEADKDKNEVLDLHKAIEENDKNSVIEIILQHTEDKSQLEKLATDYEESQKAVLIEKLENVLDEDMLEAITAIILPPIQNDAKTLFYAMKGIGTKELLLIEILCSRNNEEIKNISEEYRKKYGKSLEEDIKGDTSGDFERLLTELLKGQRDETTEVNEESARNDASALYEAGVKKFGTDEDKFIDILTSKSYAHLKAVMAEYEKIAGVKLHESIKDEMGDDLKDGLLTLLSCVQGESSSIAKRLNNAFNDGDTSTVARIIAGASKSEQVSIEEAYNSAYDPKLDAEMDEKCSKELKKVMTMPRP